MMKWKLSIPHLEDLSFWQRIAATVVIIIIVCFLLFIAAMLTVEGQTSAPLVPSKWDALIIDLDKQALDHAYQEQITHIFSVWVKDGVPPPQRAAVGFRNARRAYVDAMNEIEKREQALQR